MNESSSAKRLRRRAALAGYGTAAAAGAITVGLIAGVGSTAADAAKIATTGTSTSDSSSTSSDDSGTSSTGGVGATQQNSTPVAGSHGS